MLLKLEQKTFLLSSKAVSSMQKIWTNRVYFAILLCSLEEPAAQKSRLKDAGTVPKQVSDQRPLEGKSREGSSCCHTLFNVFFPTVFAFVQGLENPLRKSTCFAIAHCKLVSETHHRHDKDG